MSNDKGSVRFKLSEEKGNNVEQAMDKNYDASETTYHEEPSGSFMSGDEMVGTYVETKQLMEDSLFEGYAHP